MEPTQPFKIMDQRLPDKPNQGMQCVQSMLRPTEILSDRIFGKQDVRRDKIRGGNTSEETFSQYGIQEGSQGRPGISKRAAFRFIVLAGRVVLLQKPMRERR